MSQIKVLPVSLRNKIAAGEVIERPASVVKELLENSIDAGSTEISVEVLSGGKRLILVSDNGFGMDRDDALLCFERHATSKILEEDDLFRIMTLGFRGEALPSIASVSKVKMTTGVKGSSVGLCLELEGGELKEIKDAPVSGTSIEIRDIFFNTPPRRKFLKTDPTELLHITDTVTRAALSHYTIGFRLSTDNRETLILPKASGLRERIMQVYGEEFLRGLLEISASHGEMQVEGLVSDSSHFRNSKDHQFLFVNKRPIRDQSLSHAVYRAYEGIIPADKHPIFFLHLVVDPKDVDFNVHPTKREVRFAEKEAVYRFVNRETRSVVKGDRTAYADPFGEAPAAFQQHHGLPSPLTPVHAAVAEDIDISYKPSLPFIYLGDTFVALSGKGGLTLIDHHAAHERVLYERFLRKVDLAPRLLLFPQQVKLSHQEYMLILEHSDLISEFGIDLDDFGHDSVVIRSLPEALEGSDIRGILADIASAIREGTHPNKSMRESVAARIACHSSVRGREILGQEEISRLLSDLEKTEHPDQCPHGRPTRIFYSLDDLQKMFKRK